jgi:hypothetical protein
MDDDESTYITESDAAKATMSCHGYPNLVDCVLDTFEEAVKDQRWFRFLRTKYDSLNHLVDDETATLMTQMSIADMTFKTNETFQTYETATTTFHSTREEGKDGSDNETMISEGEETTESVVIIRDCDTVEDQGQREAADISDDDSDHEYEHYDDELDDDELDDDEEDDGEEDEEDDNDNDDDDDDDDEDEFYDDDDDDEEEEEGEEEEGEVQEVEVQDYLEVDNGVNCEIDAGELGDDSNSQVELDQDGSVIGDMADTNTVIPSLSVSPEPSKKAADSSDCSIISFPSLGAPSSDNQNSVLEQGKEDTTPSLSSLQAQNVLVPNALPAVSLHSRQTSKDTKASQGTSNTRNTAETSLGSHKTDHNAHEVNDSVEVIGVKRKKPLAFFRFWKKRLSNAKKTKPNSSSKENSIQEKLGLDHPAAPNSMQHPFKEKFPKTRVIVTRTSE